MKLISFGCSLVFGTDLADDGRDQPFPRPSRLTWPALLAEKFGLEYECRAYGGRGNVCILDRLMQEIDQTSEALFVIQWTFIDRFDYSDPNGKHFGKGPRDWSCILPGTQGDLAELYYRDLHSEYRDKLVSLAYMQLAIHSLEKKNCRYLMTCVDDLIWCDRWHSSPGMISSQQSIKPHVHDFEGRNFLDWSRYQGFEISPSGHPLAQAHAAAAKLLIPKIDAILHPDHS